MAKSDNLELVQKVNDAEKLASSAMRRQLDTCREAINAMQNKLPVSDPFSPNITVGRLAADIETIVPRDVQALVGNRPYMPFAPIERNNPEAVDWAATITDVIDYYTDIGKFYTKFADMMRMVRPLGWAYMEPRWSMWPVSIYSKQVERDAMGRVVRVSANYEDTVEEGVDIRILDPSSVRPHPYGNTLDEKPEVCVVELVHKNEIKRLLETPGSSYKVPDGVTEQDLFGGVPEGLEWQQQVRRDKGELTGEAYKDVAVLIRYYSEDRWIHTLNRQWVIMDTENQNINMPKFKKPFAMFRNMSHCGPDRFWPVGDYEFMMDLYWLGDMWLNLYAKAAQMAEAQWILYNPNLVQVENLKATSGARIPVADGEFDRAIRQMKVGEPPSSYLDFYRETKGLQDNRLHINDWVAGREPTRKETATAVNQLSQAGMTHMEFGITYIEQGGFADLAYLMAKIVAANQTDADRAKIIGWERAQNIVTVDPEAIPGGYRLEFKGSDRVQRQQQRAEKVLQGYNLVRGQQTLKQPWVLDRIALETLEVFDGDQLDAMGLTADAQAMQPMGQPMGQEAMPSLGGGQVQMAPPEMAAA